MEKRNTMLLTVIAVATLLVAVVGATFAYFSLTIEGQTKTTAGEVKAPNIGTATITTTQSTLSLSVSAEDMAKQGENVKYYASVSGDDKNNSNPIQIASMSYEGGETNTTYKCPVQTEVSVSGKMITEDTLKAGWTKLILEGAAVNKSNAAGMTGVENEDGKYQVDLKTAPAASAGVPETANGKVIFKGEVTVNGPSMEETNILSASLYLENLENDDQSAIAESNLSVTIKVTPDGACTLQS